MLEYPKIDTLFERDPTTRKVDELIVKNPLFTQVKTWEFTEKIDGTNISINWEPRDAQPLMFGARAEFSQIPAQLVNWLNANISIARLRETFPETNVILYGEGYGAGIQKVGHLYSPRQKFILFDVLVKGTWWLGYNSVKEIANSLGLDVVPHLGNLPLEKGIQMVKQGFKSLIYREFVATSDPLVAFPAIDPAIIADAEGLVGKSNLYDNHGHRLVIKLKTRDF